MERLLIVLAVMSSIAFLVGFVAKFSLIFNSADVHKETTDYYTTSKALLLVSLSIPLFAVSLYELWCLVPLHTFLFVEIPSILGLAASSLDILLLFIYLCWNRESLYLGSFGSVV